MNNSASDPIQFYLAPMESVTGYVYRNVYHAMFGDMDKYVTPFIAPSKKKILKTRERKDVAPEYNRYPISEVMIHPRLQKDFYNNHPNLDIFAETLQQCVHPICYNGDIFTVEDYRVFRERFPQVDRIMLGRGVIANPGLVREIRTGQPVTTAELKEYHDRLYAGYREEMDCERDALFKMKEVWFYLGKMFPDAERELKKVKKADRPEEYLAAVRSVFTLPVHALQ